WASIRSGAADPMSFGISSMKEFGAWVVAGNLVRDFAALNNMEMLPWDVWGVMPGPSDEIGDDLLPLFDRLAELTRDPDRRLAELRELYQQDERVRVPPKVKNDISGCEEVI